MEQRMEWFALRVRPRVERMVAQALDRKGFEQFLPMHRERRRWSDRVSTVETPVFPGYVFCRFDVLNRLPILKTPGVAHVVGIGRAPHPLDEQEVQSLRVLVGSELPVDPWPFLHVGQRIDIVGGPLAGASGILLHVKGKDRLVVSISLLQRSVAVEVPQGCALPATA